MTAHPIDTEALRRLADQATPGPWPLFSGGEYVGGVGLLVAPDDGGVSPANAAFIAAARTAVPALLDALAAAEHRATRAEAQSEARRINAEYWKERAESWQLMWRQRGVKHLAAEARIKAVREVLEKWETNTITHQTMRVLTDIRRALDA